VRKPASEEALAQTFSLLLRRRSVTFWHLWQMRVILETEVAGLAAEHRTPTHLHTLRQTILAMENPDATLEGLVDADMAFHQTLAQAANNPLIELIFSRSIIPKVLSAPCTEGGGQTFLGKLLIASDNQRTNVCAMIRQSCPNISIQRSHPNWNAKSTSL
jgi:hypothetical protein